MQHGNRTKSSECSQWCPSKRRQSRGSVLRRTSIPSSSWWVDILVFKLKIQLVLYLSQSERSFYQPIKTVLQSLITDCILCYHQKTIAPLLLVLIVPIRACLVSQPIRALLVSANQNSSSIVSVSCFYAECPHKKICFNAHIWTKSRFYGMSIGVNNIGEGKPYPSPCRSPRVANLTDDLCFSANISLLDKGEDYNFTFPNAYCRYD